MSDLVIRRAVPNADALIDAVTAEDQQAVADVLATLDREQLYALAIVLADRAAPMDSNANIVDAAIAHAARTFGTTASAIVSASRFREDVDARAVACYIGRLFDISHSEIGRHIGRDHSTVMHAVSRVGETPRLRGIAQRIAGQLGWDREAVAG